MTEPAASPRALSPQDVAQRLAIKPEKVIAWIRSGDLRALNTAATTGPGRRPRYKISPADLAAFETARQTSPPAAPHRSEPPAGRRRANRRPSAAQQFISPD
jgi:hypothetical protein